LRAPRPTPALHHVGGPCLVVTSAARASPRRRAGAPAEARGGAAGGGGCPCMRADGCAFLFSYKNVRLTLPTLLAWSAAMCFHQACQMCAAAARRARGTPAPHPFPSRARPRSHIFNFAEHAHPALAAAPALPDFLHEALPDLSRWRAAAEVAHVLPVLHAGALMLRAFDQRALDALRTFLWVHGALMALRGACFAATLLPDASQACRAGGPYLGSCHDLVFSGHVLIMVLAGLTTRAFFRAALPRAARAALAAFTLATALFIAAARNHYTLDVLLSLVLTPLVFHAFTSTPACLALAVLEPDADAAARARSPPPPQQQPRRAAARALSDAGATPSPGASSVATPAATPRSRK